MADFNQSIDMFVVGTNGLSTAGPRVSLHLNDLFNLLKQHEERAVSKYIKMKEEVEAGQNQLLAEVRDVLTGVADNVEQDIAAENAAMSYDTQCVVKNIISEIEDLETMNQFSLKISDVLNGNRVLAQLLLPKLLSPPPSTPTPDKIIERLYQDVIKEMQETTVMYREWKRSIRKKQLNNTN